MSTALGNKKNKPVKIVEVGLRDGLQNEKIFFSVQEKFQLAELLIQAGLQKLEIGSFVRADKVPQMQGSAELIELVLANYGKQNKLQFSALVPNEIGMTAALQTPIKEISIFTAASDAFTLKNINCTVDESIERFKPVMKLAKKSKIKVRGYVSTAFYCPYTGKVDPKAVVAVTKKLLALGVYEVSVGDTIGAAVPAEVTKLWKLLLKLAPAKKFAGHFHDTRGTALANVVASIDCGIRTFDSSIAGLGGCPYAPGAAGNVSTEDLVFLLERSGFKTGVNLTKLISINSELTKKMGRILSSKVSQAGSPK